MRRLPLLASAVALASGGGAAAQTMDDMPMGAPKPAAASSTGASSGSAASPTQPGASAPSATPAAAQTGAAPGQGMSGMAGMAGMDSPGVATETSPAGAAPPPPVPTDHAADGAYGAAAMARARNELTMMHGGQQTYQVLVNLAEFQTGAGHGGYRWDGEAWFGGDINRLFLKSEGEGTGRGGVESAEIQALFSHAVGRYFNLQAGLRQDVGPSPKRTYATVGFEGLSPGFFEVSGALFVSNTGDVFGRLEGYYDQRLTQRLILQPRVELNFAARDAPENLIGSGLSNAELGLRLRYEFRREFAPYIGFSWDDRVGETARLVRAAGETTSAKLFVAGVRFWF